MSRTFCSIFFLLYGTGLCNGQFVDKRTIYFSTDLKKNSTGWLTEINSDHSISGACFKIHASRTFDNAFIIAGRDTFRLESNEDFSGDGQLTGNLVIFPNPVIHILLCSSGMGDSCEVHMIRADAANYPPGEEIVAAREPTGLNLKSLPDMVDQSVWRQGLPGPDYPRIFNQVKNVIIHHSATSNQVTDYTSAIRNIYLYHTVINHWSDIGYNYIVAPDGVIYKGRDPGNLQQDEVLGAHFCKNNTGTLGICVLGTYTDISPTNTSMQSLEKLIVWKLARDKLDPLGVTPHPLNPDLDVIAGHRDGCATLCPGDSLYADLAILRNRVHEAMVLLGSGPDEGISSGDPASVLKVYPNPATGLVTLESSLEIREIEIFDSMGRLIFRREGKNPMLDVSRLSNGWYQLVVICPDRVSAHKILKY